MRIALRFPLRLQLARGVLACAIATTACGDGIGNPIRRALLEQAADASVPPADAAADAGGAVTAGFGGMAGPGGFPHGFPQPNQQGGEVSADRFCMQVAESWLPEWAERELRMFELIAELRQLPEFMCQGQTYRGLGPLQLIPELRCSARMHSADMAWRGYMGIVDPQGTDPPMRMAAAGFESVHDDWGELIEDGRDHSAVLNQLVRDNRFACQHLGSDRFNVIGIGYAEDGQGQNGGEGLWTIDFARR